MNLFKFYAVKHLGHLLFYVCDTGLGSGGAPLFKVVNKELRLIGLHRGKWRDFQFKFGTVITKVIEHIRNGGPLPRPREYE